MLKKTCLIVVATLMTAASVPSFAAAKPAPSTPNLGCGIFVPWCPKY